MTQMKHPLLDEAEYAEAGGGQCPYCLSSNLEGDQINFYGDGITQRVTCLTCDTSWFDTYTLTGYEPS